MSMQKMSQRMALLGYSIMRKLFCEDYRTGESVVSKIFLSFQGRT